MHGLQLLLLFVLSWCREALVTDWDSPVLMLYKPEQEHIPYPKKLGHDLPPIKVTGRSPVYPEGRIVPLLSKHLLKHEFQVKFILIQ